tara:strand:+ start:2516 stop:2848 length:333 start_codon:yes stop_codon:yes gene_type:complete
MIKYILIHTALIAALLFPNTTLGIKTKGSFTTQQIRMLWMGCYQGANMKSPQSPQVNGMVCDCILDKTRELYTYDDIQKKSGKPMQDEYSRLADVCINELGLRPNPELSI